MNSLQLTNLYRDTWGYYDAMVNPAFAPLDHNRCYKPKYYEVPDVTQQLVAPGAFLQYNFSIVPGSLIIGFLNNDATPLFTLQITDVARGCGMFDAPISNYFVTNNLLCFGKQYPSLFSSPYPVVGSGLFNVDLWANAQLGGTTRCAFTLLVAEAVLCP